MKKETHTETSKEYDGKRKQDRVTSNPSATKNIPQIEDKGREVRQKHTNHFTNREGYPEKK